MNPVLANNVYFVKEHTGIFKAANNFDIYDESGQNLLINCREENLGFFTKLLRFSDFKRMTPFHLEIRTPSGELLFSVKRGISFFISTVEVFDGKNELLGTFHQKFWSIGGRFDLFDVHNNPVCTLQGNWSSWEFSFHKDGNELASVSKKWAGFAKEMFTSADNYIITIKPIIPPDSKIRMLILASVLCIDMVLKE